MKRRMTIRGTDFTQQKHTGNLMANLMTRVISVLVLGLLVNACASTGGASSQERNNRDYLYGEDLSQSGYSNVHEAIVAFKPQWLTIRGQRSLMSPGFIQAYFDGTKIGSAEMLRNISISSINYIRYYDGIDASARWGLDHEHGAIFVSTRPLREGGF